MNIGVGASALCFRSARPVLGTGFSGRQSSVEVDYQSQVQIRDKDRKYTSIFIFSVIAFVIFSSYFPSALPWQLSFAASILLFKYSIYWQLPISICSAISLLVLSIKSINPKTFSFHTDCSPGQKFMVKATLTFTIGTALLFGLYTYDVIHRSTRSFAFQVELD